MRPPACLAIAVAALCLLPASSPTQTSASSSDHDWPTYGGDPGGQRHSNLKQINNSNVASLQVAWTFHTGFFKKAAPSNRYSNFEATPVLWNNTLFFDSPFDATFALDAATGKQLWAYDPGVDRDHAGYLVYTSRGVALWHGKGSASEPCAQHRVFIATIDRRLIARDALTGLACDGFGVHGTVDLTAGMGFNEFQKSNYGFTSPPTVVGDVIVLGSSIADNVAVSTANGAVRGFDARTGRQLWSWDPIPWAVHTTPRAGSANAWSIISADPQHDLIFVPTGSTATDFYGGQRPGDDRDADSIVALRASTGKKVWAFQLVHHDIWDYDTPSEPLLFTFRNKTPAVAVTEKTGMVFVFNRLTGAPLYPIIERPVPQSDLPGEKTWPTQPFSTLPTLNPLSFGPSDITLKDPADQDFCRKALSVLVNRGVFTPPSTKSTLFYPGSLGGANWGSPGFDPATGMLYVHTNSFAYALRQDVKKELTFYERARGFTIRHTPAWFWPPAPTDPESKFRTPDGGDHGLQEGTPYYLLRQGIVTPKGVPCAPQPWGSLIAINLNTGIKTWSVPQGTMLPGEHTGSIGMGGPAVTAGGLVFIGATTESLLRAYDSTSGKILWEQPLPAPANATPMTYAINGRQFVVVAAGGEGMLGNHQEDTVVAFALPATPGKPVHSKPPVRPTHKHVVPVKDAAP